MREKSWMSAADAARTLRVSRATLYAYVSRGMVRSQATPGMTRERAYAREDVEHLRRRTEERRAPDKAAARALRYGLPVLESAISLIDGRHIYYRGHDAIALARSRSLQEVASLIWTGAFDRSFEPPPAQRKSTIARALPFIARAQLLLAAAAADDPQAFDTKPESVAACGWRIVQLLTRAATLAVPQGPAPEAALAAAWRVSPRGADLLRSALVLCADHELNVSSFTARCVASAGATPYAVVLAGLSALGGTRHGGASARAESLLDAIRREPDVRRAVTDRLQRGDRLEGFGHPLYPAGDPRAEVLLQWLRERFAGSGEIAFARKVVDAVTTAIGVQPNIDFALAVLARVLRLPAGTPLTIFAIGRTIGWIGHAIEQYDSGQIIRPRAKYVGVVPSAA
jgi:citrate synthase